MNSGNSIKVDFKHFIKLAKANIISWDSLSNLLNETTSTLNLSKELNKILLEELKRSEMNLLKNLAKDKEVQSIESNGIVESKSIGIQTADKEKEAVTVESIDNFPNGKPTEVKYILQENPPLNNKAKLFDIKHENEADNEVQLADRIVAKESSSKALNSENEFSFDARKDLAEKELLESTIAKDFEGNKVNHKNVSDSLEVPIQESFENNAILKRLENKANNVEEYEFGIEENILTEFPKAINLGKEPTNSSALLGLGTIDKNKDPYKCRIYSKACISNSDLRVHKQSHTEETRSHFETSSTITDMNKESESKNLFQCKECDREFTKSSQMKKHERSHSDEKPYECQTCKKTFTQKGSLKIHMRYHTGENPYKCKLCIKSFPRMDNLVTHERHHLGEKPYECKHCGKRFINSSYMRKHEKTHILTEDRSRPYQCENCGKTFCTKDSLQKHLSTHTGEKPHKCKICAKTFAQASTLNIHSRIHSGEKPYECETCQKRFAITKALTAHKKIHPGEKPHKCKVCEKCFRRPYNLRKHLRRHSGERNHKCKTCFKGFFEANDLKDHERTHTGEKPYECKICDRKFSWPKSLKKHKIIHNEEDNAA